VTGFLDGLPGVSNRRQERPDTRVKPEIDCVTWRSWHCPRCGVSDCPVTDSRQIPIRKHKCSKCGKEFRSYEANYSVDPP